MVSKEQKPCCWEYFASLLVSETSASTTFNMLVNTIEIKGEIVFR